MADAANDSAQQPAPPNAAANVEQQTETVISPSGELTAPSQPPATESEDQSQRAPLWLRRADQLFVGVCLTAMVALLIVYWGRLSGWGMRPVEIERLPHSEYQYRIDINRATWVEWAQLDGIGTTLAHRIVDHREQTGPFQSIADVSRVKGIGPKTLEKIRPHLEMRDAEK